VTGVVLALSIAYAVLAALGLVATRREIGRIEGRRLVRSLLKILAAGTVMYLVARMGTLLLGAGSDLTARLIVLVTVGGASLSVYMVVAYLLRTEELESAFTLLRRRSTGKSAG
jgi:putative peptidoglycan lipid II flippase